jgi:hypothetical protein
MIQDQMKNMLASGVIESSTSEYASPVVIGKKKNDQPRFCVDYCKLNAARSARVHFNERYTGVATEMRQM